MVGVVAGIITLLALLTWFFWPGSDTHARRSPTPRDDVDEAELEEAEREVQEAPDEHSVRDWGPGTQQPPLR